MTALWILLLALTIFIMYMWLSGSLNSVIPGGGKPAPGCSACAKKNVPAVE
jgi:hypothetical protein